jgi:hypothetical protein
VGIPFSWSSFLGIALVIAGAALYALRSLRPALARDYDIFFSAVALLCGGILFFQGWRQDPILQFGQFLLAGSACFFAVESIRLRSVATEQAKRNTPIVDDDRPVNPRYTYNAELDELPSIEDRIQRRRIPGSREARPDRDEYDDDYRRRPSTRSRDDRLNPGSDRPRRRRPRPEEPPAVVDEWDDEYNNEDDRPTRRTNPPRSSRGSDSDTASRPRRSRPARDRRDVPPSRERDNPDSSDYVDYKPVDSVDDETDNWGDY